MKRLLGGLIILAAVAGAIYIGGWLFLIKAIIDFFTNIVSGITLAGVTTVLVKVFIGIPLTVFVACGVGLIGLIIMETNN